MIKRILFFALSWGLSVCAFAQNPMEEYLADSASVTRKANFSDEKHFYGVKKAEGDSAYMKNDYVSAIQIYESLLQEGEAAEVYYNLGNSYYKTDNIGKAILNYERALLLQPDNGDIRTNLEIARSKTVDKTTPIPEIFFVTWIRSLINVLSMDAWAKSGIVFFILLLISLSFFLLSKQVWKKRLVLLQERFLCFWFY